MKNYPKFINAERENMKRALDWIVKDLQRTIKAEPIEHTEYGCDEPTIDVRLCLDPNGWIFRTGLVDYDPYHSEICAASCVGLETTTEELLEELLDQALDQIHDLKDSAK